MQIEVSTNKNLAKVVKKVTIPGQTKSYNLCVKADALRFAKMYKDAVQTYLQAIMLDRNEPKAYSGLASAYKYLKEYKKAEKTLLKLVELDNENDENYMELGVCCLSDGRPEEAIPYLIKSITLNKENVEAQIQLAIAHELVEETDLSLMIYNKIIETNPGFLKAYYNKAAMLMGMGDYMEAARTFFQLIKLNPDYYKGYLGIAMSFDKMAKYKDAIRYYKKFLNLKQFSEDAVFARERILELKKEHFSKDNKFTIV